VLGPEKAEAVREEANEARFEPTPAVGMIILLQLALTVLTVLGSGRSG
jgi:hypothetical protein